MIGLGNIVCLGDVRFVAGIVYCLCVCDFFLFLSYYSSLECKYFFVLVVFFTWLS